MSEPATSHDAGAQRRRSTRVDQAAPVTVTGVDALGQAFKELTSTVTISCHGCRYQTKHYVQKNSSITLEISRLQAGLPPRMVTGRVVWVQRPHSVRELFQIGLDFDEAANPWGIAFPPEDWFPYPDDNSSIATPPEAGSTPKAQQSPARSTHMAIFSPAPAAPPVPPPAADESGVREAPSANVSDDVQQFIARHVARAVADAKETIDRTLHRSAQDAVKEELHVLRQQMDIQVHDAVERAVKTSLERVSETALKNVLQQAADRTAAMVEGVRKASEAAREDLDRKIEQTVQRTAEQVARQAVREHLTDTAEAAVARALSEREAHALETPDIGEGARSQIEQWKNELDSTLNAASQKASERLNELARRAIDRSEQSFAARSSEVHQSIDEAAASAKQILESFGAAVQQQRALIEQAKSQIDESTRSALEQNRRHLDEILAARLQAALADQTRQVSGQTARMQDSIRAVAEQTSQQTLTELLGRLRRETANLTAEFDQSCRAILSKAEEELDQKGTEAQHTTYEELLKASDWYQKKAQTTMQSALEKTVEQSAASLRHRAAEISSLAASELERHERTYAEHARARMDDAAKEVEARERVRLNETADIACAEFADRVQRDVTESLRRFEEASRQAIEAARSEAEHNRENSLDDLQKRLDEKMLQSVEHARTYLQSQLAPLLEGWEEKRQARHSEWMEQLQKSADASIRQFRERLENTSNSWLLASATTLGQQSQAVVESLARSTEQRIRQACASALLGMSDALKAHLLKVASEFHAESNDETGSGND